jgi:hypothetical protein
MGQMVNGEWVEEDKPKTVNINKEGKVDPEKSVFDGKI